MVVGKTSHRVKSVESKDFRDLFGDIFQAGLEPARRPETLNSISQDVQTDLVCNSTPMPARPEQALYLTQNFSDTTHAHFSAHYHWLDAWKLAAQNLDIDIQGLVAFGKELIPLPALQRIEFSKDLLKPHGMEWLVIPTIFDGRADPATPAAQMAFTRHQVLSAFDAGQTRLIDHLALTPLLNRIFGRFVFTAS